LGNYSKEIINETEVQQIYPDMVVAARNWPEVALGASLDKTTGADKQGLKLLAASQK